MHRRCAGVDGNGMAGADIGGELCLELACLRPSCDPAGGQRFFDLRKFGVVEIGQRKG